MQLAITTALLALFAVQPVLGQEPDRDKPAKQEESKKQEESRKPEPERQAPQETGKPQQEKQQADRDRQTEKDHQDAAKQQQQNKDRAKQGQPAQRQVTGNEHSEARNSRRIPEQDFHTHFGHEHEFRVARRDDRRFNYGGYWFLYSDPWPSAWSYDDDVYVDETDGAYYLIDPVHPGVRLLVVVSD